ncbi:MAG: hypothetical protein PVI03_01005 [Candidatus Thorarchaeota archaeon]
MHEVYQSGRKYSLPVLLPKRLKTDSDADLRFQLVSLKNAESALVVHIKRIERELEKRGSHSQILGYHRK